MGDDLNAPCHPEHTDNRQYKTSANQFESAMVSHYWGLWMHRRHHTAMATTLKLMLNPHITHFEWSRGTQQAWCDGGSWSPQVTGRRSLIDLQNAARPRGRSS